MTDTSVERLHEDLVGTLLAAGLAWREPVQRALRAVPRHLFLPEVPAAGAYAAGKTVVTKRDAVPWSGRPAHEADERSRVVGGAAGLAAITRSGCSRVPARPVAGSGPLPWGARS